MTNKNVNDIVQVKSRKWYDANKDNRGFVNVPATFVPEMADYLGEKLKISCQLGSGRYYCSTLDGRHVGWTWSNEMFEEKDPTAGYIPKKEFKKI